MSTTNAVATRCSNNRNKATTEKTIVICRSGAFGGIMGRASMISAAMQGWAISEHMVRCQVFDDEFLPEYVFGFLGSMTHGYPTVSAYRHGKDVPEIDPDELGRIPVPRLTPASQERVAAPVRAAFIALDRANAQEDEAQRILLSALQWKEETETVEEAVTLEEEVEAAGETEAPVDENEAQLSLNELLE